MSDMDTERGTGETRRSRSRGRGVYFYLSYAQSQPLAGARARSAQPDPDQWVRRFYDDLSDAVRRRSAPRSQLGPGLYDHEFPLGAERKAALTEALGQAEVFVPLYSPRYFTLSWPGREWACFQRRLASAGVADPLRRFVPVLWTPLPWGDDEEMLREAKPTLQDARSGAEPEYAENGLRVLLRLKMYRSAYERVVERLATRIVRLAEASPVGYSHVPDIDKIPSAFNPEASPVAFTVTMAAPARADLPDDRDVSGYGTGGLDWRPFASLKQTLAEYAARIAEQMDFSVLTESIEKPGDLPSGRPGVVLIDPWFAATRRGLAVLTSLVQDLKPWVLPLVVLGSGPDPRTAALADQVEEILRATTGMRGDPVRRAIRGAESPEDFSALMPILAAEAERQYRRHGSAEPASSPALRPRLADGPSGRSARPAAPLDHARENPDA